MIYRATREQIENYFAKTDYISQSEIKLYLKGWDYYLQQRESINSDKYFDEPKDYFIIGSGVDTKLTGNEGDFEAMYHISTLSTKPSDTEISIIRYVYDQVMAYLIENNLPPIPKPLVEHRDWLIASMEMHNYQSRWGVDAKLKVFSTEAMETYWTELFQSIGKQIITMEDMVLINQLETTFKESVCTSFLFNPKSYQDVFFQLPIYTSIDGIDVKALLDCVVVDYKNDIATIYDFKTMNDSASNFPADYKKRNYGFQGAFYYQLTRIRPLRESILAAFPSCADKNNLHSMKVTDFVFAVGSKTFPFSPTLTYNMGETEIYKIINGQPASFTCSVDEGGSFYEYKYPERKSLRDTLQQIYNSKRNNRDVRMSNSVKGLSIPLSNFM